MIASTYCCLKPCQHQIQRFLYTGSFIFLCYHQAKLQKSNCGICMFKNATMKEDFLNEDQRQLNDNFNHFLA